MVKVKLFGVARLKTGVSEFEADVHSEVKDLVILVNGKSVGRWYRFNDGDEVVMLSPAGGG